VLNPHSSNLDEFLHHYEQKPDFFDLNFPIDEQIISFLFLLSDQTNRGEFIQAQKKILPKEVKICTFNGWPWIEIGSPNTNKGFAMEFVCGHLGISCQDVIAFGDGENDVEMLKMAGLGVAMANADEHAIQAADATALSHDEDGVAVFLENLLPKNLKNTACF
jgi:Cof subfamily protein (haloacid dehalogenase superfamily)